jgi:hypothetical protein
MAKRGALQHCAEERQREKDRKESPGELRHGGIIPKPRIARQRSGAWLDLFVSLLPFRHACAVAHPIARMQHHPISCREP